MKGLKLISIGVTLLISLCLLVFNVSAKDEKSVVEEILDILKANGQITEEQYQVLMKKAKEELRQKEEPKTICSCGEEKTKNKNELHAYWNKGPRFTTSDGSFSMRLIGRIMTDWGYINADDDVENKLGDTFGSGAKIRRARMGLSGKLYNNVKFKSEFEFTGGAVSLKDLYFQLNKLPYIGNLQIGHFKEPFSLEMLTSSNSITFMERAIPAAFAPGKNIGFMIDNKLFNNRLSWSAGFFKETDNSGSGFDDSDNYHLTARITGTPWIDGTKEHLIHLGISYSHKFMDSGTVIRFISRPESHLAGTKFLDTKEIPADNADLLGSEFAFVYGPFSLQGEYIHSWIDSTQNGSLDFNGFYIYASYFLTGEHRSYDSFKGIFKGISPNNNFNPANGTWGAFEIGFRYSYLDLNDSTIHGGKLSDFTAGLNWYLNSNMRFMLNYIYADLDKVGDTNILQSRFQLNF